MEEFTFFNEKRKNIMLYIIPFSLLFFFSSIIFFLSIWEKMNFSIMIFLDIGKITLNVFKY